MVNCTYRSASPCTTALPAGAGAASLDFDEAEELEETMADNSSLDDMLEMFRLPADAEEDAEAAGDAEDDALSAAASATWNCVTELGKARSSDLLKARSRLEKRSEEVTASAAAADDDNDDDDGGDGDEALLMAARGTWCDGVDDGAERHKI